MRDHQGREWLTVEQATYRWGIPAPTIRSWVRRGKVDAHLVERKLWVHAPDITRAEHATRGAYLRQRHRSALP